MTGDTKFVAFVRLNKLKTQAEIGAMSKHSKGLDALSEARSRPDSEDRALVWRFDGKDDGLDVSDTFACYVEARGRPRRHKGAALAVHLILGVSPEWVAEAGDIHDGQNPRVKALMDAAGAWVEIVLGESLFNLRYDVDETGGGVVDAFAMPVATRKNSGNKFISVSKAIKDFAERNEVSAVRAYSLLQDSWAEFAREHLDPRIERGRPKTETGAQYMRPEEYKAMLAKKKEIDQLESDFLERDAEAAKRHEERDEKLRIRERELEDALAEMHAELEKVQAEQDENARQRPALDARLAELQRERAAIAMERVRVEKVRNAAAHERDVVRKERQAAEEAAVNVKKLLTTSLEGLRKAMRNRKGRLVVRFARALREAIRGLGVMANAKIEGGMDELRALESAAAGPAGARVHPVIGVHAPVRHAGVLASGDMQAGGRRAVELERSVKKVPAHPRVVQGPLETVLSSDRTLGPERTHRAQSPVDSAGVQCVAREQQPWSEGQPKPARESTELVSEPVKPVPEKRRSSRAKRRTLDLGRGR